MIGRLRSWQRCQRDNPTFGGVVEGSKSTHHSSSNSDVIFIFHQNPVMEPVAGSEMRKNEKMPSWFHLRDDPFFCHFQSRLINISRLL